MKLKRMSVLHRVAKEYGCNFKNERCLSLIYESENDDSDVSVSIVVIVIIMHCEKVYVVSRLKDTPFKRSFSTVRMHV